MTCALNAYVCSVHCVHRMRNDILFLLSTSCIEEWRQKLVEHLMYAILCNKTRFDVAKSIIIAMNTEHGNHFIFFLLSPRLEINWNIFKN